MSALESFLSPEFIRAFAWTLFHSFWQGAILALLAAVSMMVLRKHRPAIRYAMLCSLMAMIPVLFAMTFLFVYSPAGSTDLRVNDSLMNGSLPGTFANGPQIAGIETETINWFDHPVSFIENHANWLVSLWFAGFVIFLLRFSGSLFYVYRLKTSIRMTPDREWRERINELSRRIGLKKTVKLAESALAKVPMTIGYLKPVILLPLGTLSGVPPQQIDAILLHELAHILRKDYLINIIQSTIEIMFFYNPVTWWLSSWIRQEREHICDDLAIGVHHDHINYIKALTVMEELNSKSPVLASAMNGSRKKLLHRIKRIVSPVGLQKATGEGMIVFVLLVGLILTLSLNALSVIPSAYDLTGRESGERIYNYLPYNPAQEVQRESGNNPGNPQPVNLNPQTMPDTVISKSKSGKVIVKVITDPAGNENEKEIEVLLDEPEHYEYRWDCKNDRTEDRVIILKKQIDEFDSLSSIMVIKSGDSIRVIKGDTTITIPEGYDTVFSTHGMLQLYGFEIPEMPGVIDIPEIPDPDYFYFDDDRLERARNYERAIKEYEYQGKEFERRQKDYEHRQREFERQFREPGVHVETPQIPGNFQWVPQEPVPPVRNSEKIIRQELRDDGLTVRGKKYVVEIDSRSMYINGEKQPKEVYRKYRKLAESLESTVFETGDTFKMIF